MSRASRSLVHLRWRLVVAGLVAALALAACGGSSSQAPSEEPGQTSGPGETTGPDGTTGPGDTDGPTGGDGSEAFNAATTALDALDSYAFRVEIMTTTVSGEVTNSSHMVMSGIVTHDPEEASSLIQEDLDADGNVTSSTGIVVIGDEAWLGDGDTWTPVPAAQAQAFITSMASFRPEQMFSLYFAGIAGNFDEVGSESKNGIDSTHYQGDEEVGSILGAIAGFQGEWSSDVWIANDGGFLVHSEAGAEAAAGPEAGQYLIVVDITDPNDAGPIEPPA
ncbi:MAG: hypothetical protein EPO36_13190 [Chloroflexota bacterium]|nr:MAG: hypothetical protein EPO36_13190 [Chloroflexota bacterium]